MWRIEIGRGRLEKSQDPKRQVTLGCRLGLEVSPVGDVQFGISPSNLADAIRGVLSIRGLIEKYHCALLVQACALELSILSHYPQAVRPSGLFKNLSRVEHVCLLALKFSKRKTVRRTPNRTRGLRQKLWFG
jgi:hypothetical protein